MEKMQDIPFNDVIEALVNMMSSMAVVAGYIVAAAVLLKLILGHFGNDEEALESEDGLQSTSQRINASKDQPETEEPREEPAPGFRKVFLQEGG